MRGELPTECASPPGDALPARVNPDIKHPEAFVRLTRVGELHPELCRIAPLAGFTPPCGLAQDLLRAWAGT